MPVAGGHPLLLKLSSVYDDLRERLRLLTASARANGQSVKSKGAFPWHRSFARNGISKAIRRGQEEADVGHNEVPAGSADTVGSVVCRVQRTADDLCAYSASSNGTSWILPSSWHSELRQFLTSDRLFYTSLRNTASYTFYTVVVGGFIAFVFAYLINTLKKSASAFRTIFFCPSCARCPQ